MEVPDLSAMRVDYARSGLDEEQAGDDPLPLLERWLAEAVDSGMHEPNAMALATADAGGAPAVRIVLLKGLDDRGATFFTGYGSRKATEMQANPRAAAVLLWHPLQRQVRIEGVVSRIDPEESDAYFATRPRGSQLAATASPQSHEVADRAELERRVAEVEAKVGDGEVPRPPDWGGYRIGLDRIEFWQGRESRLHDRLVYTRSVTGFARERLAP